MYTNGIVIRGSYIHLKGLHASILHPSPVLFSTQNASTALGDSFTQVSFIPLRFCFLPKTRLQDLESPASYAQGLE